MVNYHITRLEINPQLHSVAIWRVQMKDTNINNHAHDDFQFAIILYFIFVVVILMAAKFLLFLV